jgi:uncharacterized protein (TIGR04255 family)
MRKKAMAMPDAIPQLPEFDNPPVQEIILSVEFDRVAGWKAPHCGAFWATIREEYPKTDAQQPLPSPPTEPAVQKALQISSDPNLVRACFINSSDTMQIQVQNDRFLTTWVRRAVDDAYPRYEKHIRPNFERQWINFLAFVAKEGLPAPHATRCEISYVNHLGYDWTAFQGLEAIFSPWSPKTTDGFLPKPELVTVSARYTWPEQGQLDVALGPAIRVADQSKLIQLVLAARLPVPAGADTRAVMAKFDVGREWVVRGFADVTTGKMHSHWKRKA